MWDPSSQAKDWNCVPCTGSPKLSHWTTREVPETLLWSQTFWCIYFFWVSSSVKQCPDGSAVKNPPAVQETRVQCLGQEDPLEEEMANPSSILAWKIPWTEESGGLHLMVSQSRTRLSTHTLLLNENANLWCWPQLENHLESPGFYLHV